MEVEKVVAAAIFIVYIIGMLVIGVIFRRRAERSAADFWKAAGELGLLPLTFSICSLYVSGAGTIGIPGSVWASGASLFAPVVAICGLTYIMAYLLLILPFRKLAGITPADFLVKRYESPRLMRCVAGVISAVTTWFYVIPQVIVGGILLDLVVGIPFEYGIAIISLTYIIYTFLGGMWSVAWTDVVQGIILFGGCIAFGAYLTIIGGGYAPLLERAAAARPAFAAVHNPLTVAGMWYVWLMYTLAWPAMVMRIFTGKDPATIRKAFLLSGFLHLTYAILLWIPGGAWAAILYPTLGGLMKSPDYALPAAIIHLCGPLVLAVFASVIAAACMSTSDALLLSASACIVNDVVRTFKPEISDRLQIRLGRILIIVLGLLAMLFVYYRVPLIYMIVAMAVGATISAFLFPMILGLYWSRITKWGALSGILGGIITYCLLFLTKAVPTYSELIFGSAVSLALTLIVSAITRPPSKEVKDWLASLRAG